MNLKKSALLLSLVAAPAIVSFVDENPASANTYYYDSQVEAVIQLISKIDPTSPNYSYYLNEAHWAYNNLTATQRYYVTNANVLFYYLGYTPSDNTNYQTIINNFTKKMNAISFSKPSFLRDVQEASRYYNSLTATEQSYLPQYLINQLTTYNENIIKMRAVELSLNSLDPTDPNYTFYYHTVIRDYQALPYNYRVLIQDLANEKTQEYNRYHSVEYNRAVAQKVVTAISNLSTTSKAQDVAEARKMYNALTVLQQSYVTNLRDLQYIEDVQKNIANGWDPYYDDEEVDDFEDYSEITVTREGNAYYISMPVSEMNTYSSTKIDVSNEITLKIPRAAVPASNKSSAVVSMIIEQTDEAILFSASMYNENVQFSSYIDIEVKGLPAASVFFKLSNTGEKLAVPHARVLNKHVIKTKSSASFVRANENPVFYDIQADGHRYEIQQLAKRKIVSGIDNHYFKPRASVSLAQYSAMISRAMDLTAKNGSTYTDVQGKWYENDIQALLEAGILDEKSSNTFNAQQTVTRGQAAKIAVRMLQHADVAIADPDYSKIPFTDFKKIPKSDRYYVAIAYEFGIFGGKDNGKFDANSPLTRSQMAKVLYRTLQVAKMI